MWLSVLVPWLVESYRLISPSVSGWGGVDAWGWRYSSLLAINTWAGQHLQGVDVVVVGYLFSSSASADYALAVRFAVLFPFFQFIFARNAAPKLGALVRDVSTREINVQLQQIRTLSMFSVCALVSGALLIAPVLIALVGTFDQTVHLMMALAIPALFRSAFAGVDVVLRMTGRPGVSALTAIAGLVLVVLFPATFGHYFGIMSVPFAMSMYAITINSILFVVLKGEGIIVTTRSEVFKAILSSSTLFFGIFFGSDLFLILISVVGPLFVFLYISFRLLRNSDLRAQFAPKM
jgi:O-antigen/teichoic acid export membrane protein